MRRKGKHRNLALTPLAFIDLNVQFHINFALFASETLSRDHDQLLCTDRLSDIMDFVDGERVAGTFQFANDWCSSRQFCAIKNTVGSLFFRVIDVLWHFELNETSMSNIVQYAVHSAAWMESDECFSYIILSCMTHEHSEIYSVWPVTVSEKLQVNLLTAKWFILIPVCCRRKYNFNLFSHRAFLSYDIFAYSILKSCFIHSKWIEQVVRFCFYETLVIFFSVVNHIQYLLWTVMCFLFRYLMHIYFYTDWP